MFGCEGKTDRRHGEDRCDETHRELLVTGCMGDRQTKPCKRLANICQQVCLGFTIRTETWRQVGTLGWSDRTSNSPNTSALPVTRSVSHQSSTAFPHLTFFSCSLTPILSPPCSCTLSHSQHFAKAARESVKVSMATERL